MPDRQSISDSVGTRLLDILQETGAPRIHVHDYSAQNVPSLREAKHHSCSLRAERALVMAQPGDLVLLNHPPDPRFLDYLDDLKLGAERDAIIAPDEMPESLTALTADGDFTARVAELLSRRIPAGVAPCITTYFPASNLLRFRSALEAQLGTAVKIECGSEISAQLANSKDQMRLAAQRLGIPIAPGEIITVEDGRSRMEKVLSATQKQLVVTSAAIIRGVWSSSGADVLIQRDPLDHDSLREWLNKRPHLHSYLVEALLPITSSPNFQLWIDEHRNISTIGVTGQRLRADSSHHGNVYPYRSRNLIPMQSAVLEIATLLAEQGFQGPLGVDMMEYPDSESGQDAFAFAETNGRMNASTYVFGLQEGVNRQRQALNHTCLDAWVSHTDTPVSASDFSELRHKLGDILYTHEKTAGVIPFNTGLLAHGMVDLLSLAGSVNQALEVEREALKRLAVG